MVPFNRPRTVGRELAYVQDAIERGAISGDGYYAGLAQGWLEERLGAARAILTTSCTDALEMCALLLDLRPGDEVIMPSFTFVSTASAFVLRGARPVFVDIRPDTLNIDERLIEAAITPKTRAIVVVHYAGVGCEMDEIVRIARRHGIALVEDNAHGLLGRYRGRVLGSFGSLATQSFHETKNIICGEGGALIVNDASLVEHALILRDKGTDRSRFLRGLVDKYSWVAAGSSFLPSDMLAAFLYAQMECAGAIQARRRAIWERYERELTPWSAAYDVRRPFIPDDCEQAYHMYYLLLPTRALRDAFIAHLKAREVYAVFHYVPLHSSEFARANGLYRDELRVTDERSGQLVRLPFFENLTEDEQGKVIDAVQSFQIAPSARQAVTAASGR